MIWFDLDNTPHIPLFRPVFKELKNRKELYFVTARDFAQTKDLLNLYKIEHQLVGTHAGKNKINKIVNLFVRSASLKKRINTKSIKLAVSHGSRTQLLAAKQLGIRSLLMLDYEYTESRIFNAFAEILLVPVYIPDERLKKAGFNLNKIIRYNGFKEELYLKDFIPDVNFRKSIETDEQQILIVFRPPSMVGNYHDKKSEKLLLAGLKYLSALKNVKCIIVNRTHVEKKLIQKKLADFPQIEFLKKAVDGLQLLYASDIVISGGGTMNREAALLGTETYSIFTGRRPYLDEYLKENGKLNFIEDTMDFRKIIVEKKAKIRQNHQSKNLAREVTELIIDFSRKREIHNR
jgi:uncharacterized protein